MSTLPIAPDAEIVLGIAATAIPFARTPEEEAERWLRVLRLHGEVGSALQALGVSEVPLRSPGETLDGDRFAAANNPQNDGILARVTDHAARLAAERGTSGLNTTDVLIAVMEVYGTVFERALRAHGTDSNEVLERLGARPRG